MKWLVLGLLLCCWLVSGDIPVHSELARGPGHARLTAEFMDSWDRVYRAVHESAPSVIHDNEHDQDATPSAIGSDELSNRFLHDDEKKCPAGHKRISGVCRLVQ